MEFFMEFLTRKFVDPKDLNIRGTLSGGKLLSWAYEEAAIFAILKVKHDNLVTKSMSAVEFVSPAFKGDIIEIGVALKCLGKTSMTLTVHIRNALTKKVIAKIDEMVFVCIDDLGKPTRYYVKD